jgi:hypothetical protein
LGFFYYRDEGGDVSRINFLVEFTAESVLSNWPRFKIKLPSCQIVSIPQIDSKTFEITLENESVHFCAIAAGKF